LHNSLIVYLSEALQARLPEPYFPVIAGREWFERAVQPDVVMHRQSVLGKEEGAAGNALVSAARARPIVITVPHDEKREPFVEIRTHGDTGELLVPSSKC
jgi:hypothetical protein